MILAVASSVPLASAMVAQTAPSAPNVIPLTMKTPRGGFNRMVLSVTLCAPGTGCCATIEDVMVDTGRQACGSRLRRCRRDWLFRHSAA